MAKKRPAHSCKAIWTELKKKGTVTIVAVPELKKMIEKEVINEKYIDLGYKLECDLEGVTKRLHIVAEDNVVTFSLIDKGRNNKKVADTLAALGL
jgi:hypothetical protein